jgi:hypothetical protein
MKLCQRHPCFNSSVIVVEDPITKKSLSSFASFSSLSYSNQLLSYCEDENLQVFEVLLDVISLAISQSSVSSSNFNLNQQIIRLSLKVLKINLWNVAKAFPIVSQLKGMNE